MECMFCLKVLVESGIDRYLRRLSGILCNDILFSMDYCKIKGCYYKATTLYRLISRAAGVIVFKYLSLCTGVSDGSV